MSILCDAVLLVATLRRFGAIFSEMNSSDYEKIPDRNKSTKIGLR